MIYWLKTLEWRLFRFFQIKLNCWFRKNIGVCRIVFLFIKEESRFAHVELKKKLCLAIPISYQHVFGFIFVSFSIFFSLNRGEILFPWWQRNVKFSRLYTIRNLIKLSSHFLIFIMYRQMFDQIFLTFYNFMKSQGNYWILASSHLPWRRFFNDLCLFLFVASNFDLIKTYREKVYSSKQIKNNYKGSAKKTNAYLC